MTVELIQNKFGRPYPGYPHHWIGLGVKVTGGSGSYEMRFKPYTDWDVWFDVPTTSTISNNKDGYIAALGFWHGVYDIQVKDKVSSETQTFTAYELFYNNQLTGLPMSDTPVIVNDSINPGLSSTITVQTVKGNSIVRIYRSRILGQSGNQGFERSDEPYRTGISNSQGLFTITLPITSSGVMVCATAQAPEEFESMSTNYLVIGGSKNKQLKANISYGTATGTGRKLTVSSVSGGSGSYSIGIVNNGAFPYSVGQEFEIPFGKSNLFVKDNNSTAQEYHISVSVDGGSGSQTFYSHDIRNNFSASSNTGTTKYGKMVGSTFTAANEYANHDGRLSWGFSGTNFPAVGIQENQNFVLNNDRVLYHPNVGEAAATEHTMQAAGTFSISGNSKRVGVVIHPYVTMGNLTTKFKIFHNTTLKYSYTHTTEGGNQDFSLSFAVASGDKVYLVVECGDENDYSFDHVHVRANMTLATAGGTVVAPNAPALSGASPVLTGAELNGTGIQAGDYVIMYLDGYPQALAITNSTTFKHGAMYNGTWTAKISRDKILSAASNAIVSNQTGNTAPPPPTFLINSVVVGSPFSATTTQEGTILIFRNGTQLTESVTTTTGTLGIGFVYTPSLTGDYTFKLSNANGTSEASEILVVTKKRKFRIKSANYNDIPISNIQSGSGTNVSSVTNWTDGIIFEHDSTVTADTKAFIRQKNNIADVSEGFPILANL
ncbi:hypothetical protein [Emticicia sp. W12TSBA100-4]|uniref:hypothetical protein n=1 Tax=Emticicia sp. W12TSBA100-4 TaxID=3160965 RepID=UPI00330600E7